MSTGLEFIPLSIMIAILGWLGIAALRGSKEMFREKAILPAISALLLAVMWLSVAGVLVWQVLLAWAVILTIAALAFVLMNLPDEKKRVAKGLFGWFCILAGLTAVALSLAE